MGRLDMADNNNDYTYDIPSFDEWYKANEEDYKSFWHTRKTERENAKDDYNRLVNTYDPILSDLQEQYNSLSSGLNLNEYRPEIGYQIEKQAQKGEHAFNVSTSKLFNTKAGKSMVQSSAVGNAMTDLYDNFQDTMEQTIYGAYTGVSGKIAQAESDRRNIKTQIQEYERKMV